jgi:hypothetical protein
VRFHVLTAASMKITPLWDIAPCSLHRRFRGAIMEVVDTSEMSVYFKETTRRYIPEDCHLQLFDNFVSKLFKITFFPESIKSRFETMQNALKLLLYVLPIFIVTHYTAVLFAFILPIHVT